jgi:hypothetical protein
MAWTCHRRPFQLTLRERAPFVRAGVIEGIQLTQSICNVHFGSRDFEDTHFVVDHVLCITHSYQHDFTSSFM